MTAICTTLCCSRCHTETPHTLMYVGPYLLSATCGVCHVTLATDPDIIRRTYVKDLPIRAIGFFRRNAAFAREHPSVFLRHLPRGVVLKPLELSSELYSLLSH